MRILRLLCLIMLGIVSNYCFAGLEIFKSPVPLNIPAQSNGYDEYVASFNTFLYNNSQHELINIDNMECSYSQNNLESGTYCTANSSVTYNLLPQEILMIPTVLEKFNATKIESGVVNLTIGYNIGGLYMTQAESYVINTPTILSYTESSNAYFSSDNITLHNEESGSYNLLECYIPEVSYQYGQYSPVYFYDVYSNSNNISFPYNNSDGQPEYCFAVRVNLQDKFTATLTGIQQYSIFTPTTEITVD